MFKFSLAFFGLASAYVTKELSATTMVVMDSASTMIVLVVSLVIGWQEFQYLQLIGFILLCIGMCIYNDIFLGNRCNLK